MSRDNRSKQVEWWRVTDWLEENVSAGERETREMQMVICRLVVKDDDDHHDNHDDCSVDKDLFFWYWLLIDINH